VTSTAAVRIPDADKRATQAVRLGSSRVLLRVVEHQPSWIERPIAKLLKRTLRQLRLIPKRCRTLDEVQRLGAQTELYLLDVDTGYPTVACLGLGDAAWLDGLRQSQFSVSLADLRKKYRVGAVHPVAAADLPTRPAYAPAPMMSPTPVYNWTGIYVGLNGGYGWGNQDPLNLITNRFDGDSVAFSGGVFGGTAGAQIQSGHVVIGFEADIDWANMKGSATFVPTIGGIPINPAAIRACLQLSRIIAAANCTPARKFLASLS
jgi:hypothetical protein